VEVKIDMELPSPTKKMTESLISFDIKNAEILKDYVVSMLETFNEKSVMTHHELKFDQKSKWFMNMVYMIPYLISN
jgi:hypothetical protein